MAADYIYTTLARIQNILSVTGVNLRLDDYPPDEVGDAINEACNEVDTWTWERYSQTQLLTSDTVAVWAATLAAWLLSCRRGNPPPASIDFRRNQVMEKLEKVHAGRLSIPRLALRKSYAPTLSIMTTVMRQYPRAVVDKTRGTGTPANYDDGKSRDPVDRMGGNIMLDYVI